MFQIASLPSNTCPALSRLHLRAAPGSSSFDEKSQTASFIKPYKTKWHDQNWSSSYWSVSFFEAIIDIQKHHPSVKREVRYIIYVLRMLQRQIYCYIMYYIMLYLVHRGSYSRLIAYPGPVDHPVGGQASICTEVRQGVLQWPVVQDVVAHQGLGTKQPWQPWFGYQLCNIIKPILWTNSGSLTVSITMFFPSLAVGYQKHQTMCNIV